MICSWCDYCASAGLGWHTPCKHHNSCECKNHTTSTNILVKTWRIGWRSL